MTYRGNMQNRTLGVMERWKLILDDMRQTSLYGRACHCVFENHMKLMIGLNPT